MATRLANGRREELLDGVMRIISERGFSQVRISDIAQELRCSAASLYKIAPSKHGLVLLAIGRWADGARADIDAQARGGKNATDRARTYFQAGARKVGPFAAAFFADVERFESTRDAWVDRVVGPYLSRFAELVEVAAEAGEIRPINTRFLLEMLRRIAPLTRDKQALADIGLSNEEAILQIDSIVWDGIRRS